MNKRILIVDDETNVRLNFRMTLETEGYEIFEARSAEQALERWPSIHLRLRSSTCDAWDGRIAIARQDARKRNQGPGDDRYGIQRCAPCGKGDETRRNRLPAKAASARGSSKHCG